MRPRKRPSSRLLVSVLSSLFAARARPLLASLAQSVATFDRKKSATCHFRVALTALLRRRLLRRIPGGCPQNLVIATLKFPLIRLRVSTALRHFLARLRENVLLDRFVRARISDAQRVKLRKVFHHWRLKHRKAKSGMSREFRSSVRLQGPRCC